MQKSTEWIAGLVWGLFIIFYKLRHSILSLQRIESVLIICASFWMTRCQIQSWQYESAGIIERSRLLRPSWLSKPNLFTENNDYFFCRLEKKNIRNLQLGIRQAEYIGLIQCEKKIYDQMIRCSPSYKPDEQKIKLLRDVVMGKAKIQDIYFERMKQSVTVTSYSVDILMQIPLNPLKEIVQSFVQSSSEKNLSSQEIVACALGE